jgi:GWxTD domain-containing protein
MIFSGINQIAEAKISACIDFVCLPAEKSGGNLLLIFGVDGRSLSFQKKQNGKYAGMATFAIVVNDSVKNYFAERVNFATPEVSDSSGFFQFFANTKQIPLPAGKFEVEILAYDALSKDTSQEKASFCIQMKEGKQGPIMSDLVFLHPGKFDGQASIVDQSPGVFRNSDFFSAGDSILSFYGEAKGFTQKFPNQNSLISRLRIWDLTKVASLDDFGKIKKIKSQAFIANRFDLNIKKLASGNYLLVWDISDSSGKMLAKSQKTFQKSNPLYTRQDYQENVVPNGNFEEEVAKLNTLQCRELVASLLPISQASEQTTLAYLRKKGNDSELRNFLLAFWTKRDKENPAGAFLQYKDLVAEANQKYSTQTMPAYQTDRGRIFLQYGKPNLIENEFSDRFRKAMQNLNTVPYEIWYFYTLEKPVKQSDVIFVFVQENRGNDNYRLLHSTGIGEVRNREWRKAVETNATYNWDRMDPNDRYDSNDSKKFR